VTQWGRHQCKRLCLLKLCTNEASVTSKFKVLACNLAPSSAIPAGYPVWYHLIDDSVLLVIKAMKNCHYMYYIIMKNIWLDTTTNLLLLLLLLLLLPFHGNFFKVNLGQPWVLFHQFQQRTSGDYEPDVLSVSQPSVSKDWKEYKALSQTTVLTSSFAYRPLESWWKGVASFIPALWYKHQASYVQLIWDQHCSMQYNYSNVTVQYMA